MALKNSIFTLPLKILKTYYLYLPSFLMFSIIFCQTIISISYLVFIAAEVKKIILDLQGGKKSANLDVMTEMSRIKLRASPEPAFSPSSSFRKLSIDGGGSRVKQYSFDSPTQSTLDALISAEILTRVDFLCDLR